MTLYELTNTASAINAGLSKTSQSVESPPTPLLKSVCSANFRLFEWYGSGKAGRSIDFKVGKNHYSQPWQCENENTPLEKLAEEIQARL